MCAFQECYALTSITLSEGISSIGYQVFYKCSSLQSVNLPKSITNIDATAFPEHVQQIRE